MGDMLTLIEKAEAAIELEDAEKMEQALRRDGFTLEQFRDQLKMVKKMGSMESMLQMIPGAGKALKKAGGMQLPDKELKKVEGEEATSEQGLGRIARGSGTSVQDVNQLVKKFTEAQKMMKKMQKLGPKGLKNMLGRGGLPL